MPQLVKPIDVIARQKRRDVLFIAFPELALGSEVDLDRDSYPPRTRLLAFLDRNGIPWSPCAYPSDSGMLIGGTELIYLDVPFEPEDLHYRLAASQLEFSDGKPRDPRVRFRLLPLAQALQMRSDPADPNEGAQS